jgi:hypothetical protein
MPSVIPLETDGLNGIEYNAIERSRIIVGYATRRIVRIASFESPDTDFLWIDDGHVLGRRVPACATSTDSCPIRKGRTAEVGSYLISYGPQAYSWIQAR